ncbi:MAG: hypothetical protein IJZ10_06035 [Thermoguttaceae bacterium]|nr:hypothetical protein [Thermoguttaceae bacterium]
MPTRSLRRRNRRFIAKKISDVKIGERAVGVNPQGATPGEDDAIFGRVKHCGYKLCYLKENGTTCEIELLRPVDWLDYERVQLRRKTDGKVLDELDFAVADILASGASVDFTPAYDVEIWVELPEMGVLGWATLEEIDDEIAIQPGPGAVVTGTFAHVSDAVIDLQIEDQPKPIGCTTTHPFWSVDRQDFVEAGRLQQGERVQRDNGETKRVVQKLPRPGPVNVYNLEVYAEHVYRVTPDGVLTHNNGCDQYYLGTGRPYLRKSTKALIREQHLKKNNGKFLYEDYHYGHKEGLEYRRLRLWAEEHRLTRAQWNDLHNRPELYEIQDAMENFSHLKEKVGKDLVGLTDRLKNLLGEEYINELLHSVK